MDVKREARWAQTAMIHWGYYRTGQEKYDFALVHLQSPFENGCTIPYKSTGPVVREDTKVRVVGYPGDLPTNNKAQKDSIMYHSECMVEKQKLATNGFRIQYLLDTAGGEPLIQVTARDHNVLTQTGNSGGPVLEVAADKTFQAIGVHCYGAQ